MSDDIKEAGTPAPLGAVGSVTVARELTVEERLARIETVLNDAIVNPPKLPDAEALSQRITSADNKANSAFQLCGATDSRLTEAAMQQEQRFSVRAEEIESRCSAIETALSHIQKTLSEMAAAYPAATAQLRVERDEQHEQRKVARHFTCTACSCEFSDVVQKAATSGPRTCPNCGKPATVVVSDVVEDDVAA